MSFNIANLPEKKKCTIRAVTYEVTAHYSCEADDLKTKLARLLAADIPGNIAKPNLHNCSLKSRVVK